MGAARSSGITSFITLRLLRKRLTTVAVGERVPQAPAGFAARGASVVLWLPGPNIIRQRDPKSQPRASGSRSCHAESLPPQPPQFDAAALACRARCKGS